MRAPARIKTRLAQLSASAGSNLRLGARGAVVEKVTLLAGRLHAEVTPLGPGQRFAVQTPEATLTVIGTAFVVSREGEQTVVEVEHGVVRAASPDGRRSITLHAGDRALFPLPRTRSPRGETAATSEASRRPGSLDKIAPRAPSRRRPLTSDARGHEHRPGAHEATPHPGGMQRARTTTTTRPPPAAPLRSDALPAPPTTIAGPDRPSTQRRRLARARRALRDTPAEAIVLARAVLDDAPAETIEAEALAVLADGFRRDGRLEEAARTYARVAAHPAGNALAEESLLQLALLRREQGDAAQARAALQEATRRYPRGVLAPERLALSIEIHWASEQIDQAALLLLRASGLHGPDLEPWRIRLAERLAPTRPADARALLEATRASSLSAKLAARHTALAHALDFSRVE